MSTFHIGDAELKISISFPWGDKEVELGYVIEEAE